MSLRIAFDCDGVIADLDSALAEVVSRLFGEGPPPEEKPAPAPEPKSPLSKRQLKKQAKAKAASDAAAQAAAAVKSAVAPAVAAATAAGAPPETAAPPPAMPDEGPSEEEVQAAPARFRALTRRQQHELWEAVRHTENFWESLDETEPGIIARLSQLAREHRWEVIFITQRPSSAGDITQLQTQRWLTAHGYDRPSVYVIKGTRGKVAEALSLDIVVDDRPENCLDVKLESRARAILVWSEDLSTIPANARRLGIEPVAGIGACLDLLVGAPEKPTLFARIKQLIRA
jgi:phosphoglycolate phosphatase-like HAD superfamily hydrolase